MILPFSTQLNGKPTFFPEKIWQSFDDEFTIENFDKGYLEGFENIGYNFNIDAIDLLPKLHTIREDKNDRWKPGTKIDFFINCRQKDMFRFAPVLPVVSVQKIEIKHHLDYISIFIDKIVYEIEICEILKTIKSTDPIIQDLAYNDGFDTIEDFFKYFNKDFTGKIIHWTDKKY